MPSTKIFITGVTGYIGGDVLYLLRQRHPTWQISCLVRDPAKALVIVSKYPGIRVVHGNLDSVVLIENEAASADIIYHCAHSDHLESARAITRGIRRNPSSPTYWIHTSGAGILTHQNFSLNNFESVCGGEKVYDDWEHIDELTSLPNKALHRHVDRVVLNASVGHEHHVKTAIICPPAIYGLGRGTGNTHSVQLNMAVRLSLKNGRALQMGNGTAIWHEVHVHDLAELYVMLGEAAARENPKASWNGTGYYLAENGSFTWGEVARSIADEGYCQGYLATTEVQSINFEQAQKYHKLFPYLCGTTSRGVSKRARTLLNWTPKQNSMMEEMGNIIRNEAKALGLKTQKQGGRL